MKLLRSHAFLLLILLLGTAFRLTRINQSLWFDELTSTRIRLDSFVIILDRMLYDVHPHLYSWIMYIWINLFGDSEVSSRMLPFLCGVGSIYLLYLVALRAFDKQTALFAAFLLAVSPAHIWYSQEAKQYSLLCFTLLCMLASIQKLEDKRPHPRLWFWCYTISALLLAFCHFFPVAIVCVFSLVFLFRRGAHWKRLFVSSALVVLANACFLLIRYSLGTLPFGSFHLRSFTLFEWWMLFFQWFTHGNTLFSDLPYRAAHEGFSLLWRKPALGIMHVVFFGVFLLGIVRIFRAKNKWARDFVLLSLVAIPIGLFAIELFWLKRTFIQRSMLVVLPEFLLVLAVGCTAICRRPFERYVGSLLTLVFVSTALFQYYEKEHIWTVSKHKPDWRESARFISEQAEQSAASPFVVIASSSAYVLSYYAPQISDRLYLWEILHTEENLKKVQDWLGYDSWLGELFASRVQSTVQSARLKKQNARIQVFYPRDDIRRVWRICRRRGVASFWVVNNIYWFGKINGLIYELRHDSRFSPGTTKRFKGLVLYEFTISRPN